MLRRIFQHKREKVLGDKRRLHSEELRNLHATPNIIRVVKSRREREREMAGHVILMGEMRPPYNIMVRKP